MKIIIRACGERTEQRCINLAKKQGEVFVIRETPFGKSIKKTYKLALTWRQKWIPVIDADVQLYPGTLQKAIDELEKISNDNILCLDGRTDDKIFMHARRAGVHIYQRKHLNMALQYIDNNHIKPETNIRRQMAYFGYTTYKSKIIFGNHDFDQYYADLWRKAVCQTRKLKRKIKNKDIAKWSQLSRKDKDFFVIIKAHMYGKTLNTKIIIDKNVNFNGPRMVRKMRLTEKGPLK